MRSKGFYQSVFSRGAFFKKHGVHTKNIGALYRCLRQPLSKMASCKNETAGHNCNWIHWKWGSTRSEIVIRFSSWTPHPTTTSPKTNFWEIAKFADAPKMTFFVHISMPGSSLFISLSWNGGWRVGGTLWASCARNTATTPGLFTYPREFY